MTVAGSAKLHAHRAARSDSMKAVGRAGLAAHGVIWLLLGILALVMAFSGRKQETDQRGALQELAQQSGGWICCSSPRSASRHTPCGGWSTPS